MTATKPRMASQAVTALVLCGAFVAAAFSAAVGTPQQTERIVRRYTKAMGGSRLSHIGSMRVTGTVTMMGFEAPFTILMKSPDRARMDVTMLGRRLVQAFDGSHAWWINPFAGAPEPARMPDDFARQLTRWASLDSPLIDHRQKNNRVRLTGRAADGTLHVAVELSSGETVDMYLDPETYLEVRRSYDQTFRGKSQRVDTHFSDYQESAGIMTPREIRGVDVRGEKYMMRVTAWEMDVAIEDDVFAMPAPPPEPARADIAITSMTDLGELAGAFNLEEATVRSVAVFSPTCSICRQGFADLKQILAEIEDDGVRAYIIFVPMLRKDDIAAARERAGELADDRVTYFWDASGVSGDVWRHRSLDGQWSVCALYAAGTTWEGMPARPDLTMSVHDASDGSVGKLQADVYAAEVRRLLDR